MVTVIIQHEVRNFSEWKIVFDADESNRSKLGVRLMGLYTSVTNPNDVTMIFEAPNGELFNKMMSDPARQKNIEKSGVISAPKASILKKA